MTVVAREIPVARTKVAWYQRKSTKENARKAAAFLLLAAGAFLFLAPVVWMLSSSLKPNQLVFDGKWIPSTFEWGNYTNALTMVPFGTYFRNSGIVTGLSVIGALLSSSLVAYAFARLRWPGRDAAFALTIATMMIPFSVLVVPQYVLFKTLGWTGTILPLVVPAFFGNVFYVFLLRQFYMTIPRELSEAALVDGSSELRTFWSIILPLTKPALIAVALFTFLAAYKDFLGPLIYLNNQEQWTISLGLNMFKNQYGAQWQLMMAASTVALLPIVVLFFLAQRTFVEGITMTGVKG
jgi:multiple sugar transport system permease protein